MDLRSIADELVAGCREGREYANLDALYAPDAVSVEGADMGQGQAMTGVDAIKAKHDWWSQSHTFHGGDIDGPFLMQPDRFAVVFHMDVTAKDTGERTKGKEVAVYTVTDGRISREEFFYG